MRDKELELERALYDMVIAYCLKSESTPPHNIELWALDNAAKLIKDKDNKATVNIILHEAKQLKRNEA